MHFHFFKEALASIKYLSWVLVTRSPQCPVGSVQFRYIGALGARVICDNIPGLVNKQRQLCQGHPDLMQSIGEGAKEWIRECQHQFRHHRWNCSTLDRDHTVFGRVMLRSESPLTWLRFLSFAPPSAVDISDADGVNHPCECLHVYQISWGLMHDLVAHLGLRLQTQNITSMSRFPRTSSRASGEQNGWPPKTSSSSPHW